MITDSIVFFTPFPKLDVSIVTVSLSAIVRTRTSHTSVLWFLCAVSGLVLVFPHVSISPVSGLVLVFPHVSISPVSGLVLVFPHVSGHGCWRAEGFLGSVATAWQHSMGSWSFVGRRKTYCHNLCQFLGSEHDLEIYRFIVLRNRTKSREIYSTRTILRPLI